MAVHAAPALETHTFQKVFIGCNTHNHLKVSFWWLDMTVLFKYWCNFPYIVYVYFYIDIESSMVIERIRQEFAISVSPFTDIGFVV